MKIDFLIKNVTQSVWHSGTHFYVIFLLKKSLSKSIFMSLFCCFFGSKTQVRVVLEWFGGPFLVPKVVVFVAKSDQFWFHKRHVLGSILVPLRGR